MHSVRVIYVVPQLCVFRHADDVSPPSGDVLHDALRPRLLTLGQVRIPFYNSITLPK